MSTVQELVALLEETKPPKQLLVYHPKFFAPKYIVDAVTKLSGKFHPPPFTSDEWEAIEAAKVLADKRKEQSRMDEVVPNLLIGNKMAAEDTKYLVEEGVTHLLNTASGENMPDGVKSPVCPLVLTLALQSRWSLMLPSWRRWGSSCSTWRSRTRQTSRSTNTSRCKRERLIFRSTNNFRQLEFG